MRQLSRTLPAARLYGLDLSPHYLKHAQVELTEIDGLSLLNKNAEATALRSDSFDVVTSIFLSKRGVARKP